MACVARRVHVARAYWVRITSFNRSTHSSNQSTAACVASFNRSIQFESVYCRLCRVIQSLNSVRISRLSPASDANRRGARHRGAADSTSVEVKRAAEIPDHAGIRLSYEEGGSGDWRRHVSSMPRPVRAIGWSRAALAVHTWE